MAIRHRRTTTPNYTWQSSDLADGQIGLNTADGTLHFKKSDNTIVNLAPGGSSDAIEGLGFLVPTSSAKPISVFGNAQLSTAQKKFGTASLLLDGTGDYISTPSNPDFEFGSGNFTIEMWVYRIGNNLSQPLVEMRTSTTTNYAPLLLINTSNQLVYNDGASNVITGDSISETTWTHVAVSRQGTSTRLFINGTQTGSTYTDTRFYLQSPVRIGARFDATTAFNGHIDELRITKGLARYTGNFTAPTAPFVYDSDTVLLLHFDGANGSINIDDSAFSSSKIVLNKDTDKNVNFLAGENLSFNLDIDSKTVTIDSITKLESEFTPTLGGNLNVSTYSIVSTSNGNIAITPNGTGRTQATRLNYNEAIHSLGTTSGTITPDAANGNVQTITLNGNLTFSAFSNPVAGQSITLIINTNGTNRTLTSTMKFAGGENTLSTTSTTDIISVFYDGTNYWASLAKDFK